MKKFPIFIGIALGALLGLLTSLPDGMGLKIVMMSIGAVAGTAIVGAFCRQRKKNKKTMRDDDNSYELGTSPEDRMNNYWRDKGKAVPFSSSPDFMGHDHDCNRERY